MHNVQFLIEFTEILDVSGMVRFRTEVTSILGVIQKTETKYLLFSLKLDIYKDNKLYSDV